MTTYNAAIGATATTTPSTASLNHAANVIIVINITYIGTTSPNAVTVGGAAAATRFVMNGRGYKDAGTPFQDGRPRVR